MWVSILCCEPSHFLTWFHLKFQPTHPLFTFQVWLTWAINLSCACSMTGNNQRATDGHTYSVLCSLHVFVSLGPFRFNHDVWLENCPNCGMWYHCVMCELFRSVSEVLQHSINFCVLSFVNSNHSLIQEFKSLSQLHSSFKRFICLRERMFTPFC